MGDLLVLLSILAVLGQGQGQATLDPCLSANYKELTDTRRSTGYRMTPYEPGLCDLDLDPGWYRFTNGAGGTMAESCPAMSQCGTLVPVWLNGTHPTVAEGIVDRKACAFYGTDTTMPCCDHTTDIRVKNCGAFFVYYLQPTLSCPVAYCAGTRTPCSAGNGFLPCDEVYPILNITPILSGPIINQHSFYFTCRVNYPTNNPDVRFEVEWTLDNKTRADIPSQEVTEGSTEAILDGSKLTGNLNHLLSCRVRAWYAHRLAIVKSPWFVSTQPYYVGFRVEPGRVVLTDQTTEAKINVTSTVPIVCNHNFTAACCIFFNVDIDGPQSTVVVAKHCSKKLCTADWNPWTNSASTEITLAASKKEILDRSRPMFLSFERILAAGGGPYLNVFNNYSLPQVPVIVEQLSSLKCDWSGDPHVYGFSRSLFHLLASGDFTMYKNDQDHFEVQSRTYMCSRTAACQCGLLIREQNDIIHINNC